MLFLTIPIESFEDKVIGIKNMNIWEFTESIMPIYKYHDPLVIRSLKPGDTLNWEFTGNGTIVLYKRALSFSMRPHPSDIYLDGGIIETLPINEEDEYYELVVVIPHPYLKERYDKPGFAFIEVGVTVGDGLTQCECINIKEPYCLAPSIFKYLMNLVGDECVLSLGSESLHNKFLDVMKRSVYKFTMLYGISRMKYWSYEIRVPNIRERIYELI